MFLALGGYEDAATRALGTHYVHAEELLAAGDYEGTIAQFEAAGDYEDVVQRLSLIHI